MSTLREGVIHFRLDEAMLVVRRPHLIPDSGRSAWRAAHVPCLTIVLDGLNDIVLPKIGTGMRELLVSPGDFPGFTVGGGGLVEDDFRQLHHPP